MGELEKQQKGEINLVDAMNNKMGEVRLILPNG